MDFFIGLDKKGRLVLPLEIREALNIKTNGKILLRVSARQGNKIILELAKAPDNAQGIPYSKNGKYVKKGDQNEV